MPKEKKEGNATRQLKLNIPEVLYERGMIDKAVGYYATEYKNKFWAYILWLGTNCYETEVLGVELHNKKAPKVSGIDKRIAELDSQVAGE